jgi:16S rRNA (guanine966-N2)-methyltransferase
MRIIAGEYRGRVLKTTSAPGYRPATSKVRQAVFSMLEARGVYWPECRVLDLFAGRGSLAFEALSRGAEEVLFVEMNKTAAKLINENAQKIGIPSSRYKVLAEDLFKVISRHESGA